MNPNLLNEVLELFVKGGEGSSIWHKPFLFNGNAGATDSVSLVLTPIESSEFEDRTEKIKDAYPENNMNSAILLDDLKIAFSNVPELDCYDEVDRQCSECGGDGNVDFEYEFESRTFYTDGECPACEGEGHGLEDADEPNGKKQPDPSKYVFILASAFTGVQIKKIIRLSEILSVNEIFITYQDRPTGVNLFSVGDCEVMLAPSHVDINDKNVVSKL